MFKVLFPPDIPVSGTSAAFPELFAFLVPSDEKIEDDADRGEQHHEKEPDDLVRAVLELAAHDVDDRREPDEEKRRAHDDDRHAEAGPEIEYERIESHDVYPDKKATVKRDEKRQLKERLKTTGGDLIDESGPSFFVELSRSLPFFV